MVFSVFLNFWMFLLTAFDSNLTFFLHFLKTIFVLWFMAVANSWRTGAWTSIDTAVSIWNFFRRHANMAPQSEEHCCLLGHRTNQLLGTVPLVIITQLQLQLQAGSWYQQQQAVMPYGSIQLCSYGRGRWIIQLYQSVFTDPLIDTNALSQYREINGKVHRTRHTDKSRIIVS